MTIHKMHGLVPSRRESPFRKKIADEIDRLILLLDSIDRDPDLEPEFDDDDADREDEGHDEYSLGAAENHPKPWGAERSGEGDQRDWGNPEPHDDREDDGDDLEPSIGWNEIGFLGGHDDREADFS